MLPESFNQKVLDASAFRIFMWIAPVYLQMNVVKSLTYTCTHPDLCWNILICKGIPLQGISVRVWSSGAPGHHFFFFCCGHSRYHLQRATGCFKPRISTRRRQCIGHNLDTLSGPPGFTEDANQQVQNCAGLSFSKNNTNENRDASFQGNLQ